MSANPLFFAPYKTPLTDPNTGLMSRPWYLFFQGLFNRVGGSLGASNDDLEQLTNEDLDIAGVDQLAIAGQVGELQALLADLPDPVPTDGTDAMALFLECMDSLTTPAAPKALVGLTAIPGSAYTYMRSDAAPALDVTINVTWTGTHAFQSTNTTPVSFGNISYTGGVTIPLANASTVSGDIARYVCSSGSTTVALYAANQNQASAIITNGPTGPQSTLRNLGNYPMAFGVANTFAFGIDNSLATVIAQVNPTAVNATATLTIAQLLTLIITSTTAAAVVGTLPTGALSDAGVMSGVSGASTAFDWSVINTGPNSFTVAAGTGHTIVGSGVVAAGASGQFRTRKTGASTFVTYRLS